MTILAGTVFTTAPGVATPLYPVSAPIFDGVLVVYGPRNSGQPVWIGGPGLAGFGPGGFELGPLNPSVTVKSGDLHDYWMTAMNLTDYVTFIGT